MIAQDIVELRFAVLGNSIKYDHGYKLYGAVKRKVLDIAPELLINNNFPDNVNLSQINGKKHNDFMYLTWKSSFKIRCPNSYAQQLKHILNNQLLEISKDRVCLLDGEIISLSVSSQLTSKIVVIVYSNWKPIAYETRFLNSCKKQLAALGIMQQPTIIKDECNATYQKVITIDKFPSIRQYRGYGVCVSDLTEQDSIALQIHGIGGKRHMGCGWFDDSI